MSGPATHNPLARLDRTALVACLAVLGFTIAYPTLRLVWGATADWQMEAITGRAGRLAIWNTVWMGFATVLCAGVSGTALALFVARYSFPGRRILAGMAYLPFALPPLVGTLSFYYLIGADGFVPRIAEDVFGIDGLAFEGGLAVLIIHTYSFYVFFYAMVSAAIERMDPSLVEAARTLGASPGLAFRKVTLPALTPALVGASLLTFMSSGASFSAPLYFGDDFPYLSVAIYNAQSAFDDALAMSYTVILACISLVGIFIFRTRRQHAGTASKGAPRAIGSQSGRIAAAGFAWVTMALLLIPHFVIVLLSFANHRDWFTEILPPVYTLNNYVEIFTDPAAFRPILNSLWMSLGAAIVTLIIGLGAGYLIGRGRPGARWVNFLVMIPWALPGTVVAMNLIIAFNDRWLPLYNTVWILPLAYFVRNVPLLTRMATASISQFDATLLEAARTLGASPRYVFVHVILPLLAPALIASTALVFAIGLGEFVASILLYTPGNIPIAIEINSQWRGSGIGSAFSYGVFLMTILTGTFVFSRRFASRII